MNILSFWAIGLERYLVKAMKDADAVITDAGVAPQGRKHAVDKLAVRSQEAARRTAIAEIGKNKKMLCVLLI